MAESFTTTNRFFDNKHYPRGFSRHGDFTIKEAQLLERMVMPLTNWNWVNANLSPKMKNSLFRYAVVNVSQPEMERVWIKYMARIKRPKRFHTLSGGKPQVEGAEDYTESDD
jgi:uncharacterized protein YifE (UPF0438 family)